MRKTPVTLGVLSMIFGSLIGVWSLLSLGLAGLGNSMMRNMAAMGGSMPHQPGAPDPAQVMGQMQAVMKTLAPYTYGLVLGKLLFSVALVVIGYGLYKRRPWARSGAIGWGALALLYLVAELSINVGIIQPRVNAVVQQMFAGLPNADAGMAMMNAMKGMQGTMTVVFTLLFYAPYPIVLILLCGRRSAAADFVD